MKTLHTIGTALLIILSTSAFADEKAKSEQRENNTVKTIKAPEFVWGSPEEDVTIVNPSNMLIKLPEFVWGSPQAADIEIKSESENITKKVMIKLPAFVWGNPEDIDIQDAN